MKSKRDAKINRQVKNSLAGRRKSVTSAIHLPCRTRPLAQSRCRSDPGHSQGNNSEVRSSEAHKPCDRRPRSGRAGGETPWCSCGEIVGGSDLKGGYSAVARPWKTGPQTSRDGEAC